MRDSWEPYRPSSTPITFSERGELQVGSAHKRLMPALVDLLLAALAQHGIVLENLRVFTRRVDQHPDLHCYVAWGANRSAEGTLRWWDDMQRVAPAQPMLYERFPDWRELLTTIWHVQGIDWMEHHGLLVAGRQLGRLGSQQGMPRRRREDDGPYRSRLVNALGGEDAPGPPSHVAEELPTPPAEPRSRYERLLDDDDLV